MKVHNIKLLFALFLAACALLPPAALHGEEPPTKGYNCVFMGHSFFYPIAETFPWGPLFDVPSAQFSDFYRARFEIPVHGLVDELRQKYPDNIIFVIPHGKGVAELYAKYKAGEIPEITRVVQPPGDDAAEAFFADTSAHIGKMPLVLSQLIWLAAIYQVDVREIEWDTGYQFDLKTMAYDNVSKDTYAQIVRKKPPQQDAGPAESTPGTEAYGVKTIP
jgi:hypothetical protein